MSCLTGVSLGALEQSNNVIYNGGFRTHSISFHPQNKWRLKTLVGPLKRETKGQLPCKDYRTSIKTPDTKDSGKLP